MNNRVFNYFNLIADKLSIDYQLTGTGTNSSDKGLNREKLVQLFLANHLPKRLYPVLGGHIFGFKQPDSKQIDIIILNDIGLNFEEHQKLFTPIENVAAAFTVKSFLTSNELLDTLENIASIPQMDKEVLKFKFLKPDPFSDFIKYNPSFFVFAYDGVSFEKALSTINNFYKETDVPMNRRPTGIIVNKKYYIKCTPDESKNLGAQIIPPFTFHGVKLIPEIQGTPFFHVFNCINYYSEWLSKMSIDYIKYFNTSLKEFYEKLPD